MERTYPAGVTSWVDVEADDVEAVEKFYGSLFGWEVEAMTPPGLPFTYRVARLDGQDVAGLGGPSSPTGTASSRWNTYVATADLEATLARVRDAGGTVTDEPARSGEAGRWAAFTDPDGARLCLWEAGHRLGAQVTNTPATWNFSDLRTHDPAGAGEFYGRVFGWELTDLGFATMIRVPGYGDHLASTTDPGIHERQAGVHVPPGFADAIGWLHHADDDEPSSWHVTFTVADRDASAARVKDLGGRVVRREDSDWTRTAVVLDPQGGELTLSQFTPPA